MMPFKSLFVFFQWQQQQRQHQRQSNLKLTMKGIHMLLFILSLITLQIQFTDSFVTTASSVAPFLRSYQRTQQPQPPLLLNIQPKLLSSSSSPHVSKKRNHHHHQNNHRSNLRLHLFFGKSKNGILETTSKETTATTTDETLAETSKSLSNELNSSSSLSSSLLSSNQQDFFFIRESIPADVGRAADILTYAFFKDNTNFITYQKERLITYLSLEGGFPKPNTYHKVFVACDSKTGKVLGMAEVDARTTTTTTTTNSGFFGSTSGSSSSNISGRGQNGPYMCNLAVDAKFKRRGIASALVKQCEECVTEWSVYAEQMNIMYLSNSLYLKVRESNEAAIAMYVKLGYQSIRTEPDDKFDGNVLVMRKQLSKPPPNMMTDVDADTVVENDSL